MWIYLRSDRAFIILRFIATESNKSFSFSSLAFALFFFIELFLQFLKGFVEFHFCFGDYIFLYFGLIWVLTMLFRYIYSLLFDRKLFNKSVLNGNYFFKLSYIWYWHALPAYCIVASFILGKQHLKFVFHLFDLTFISALIVSSFDKIYK